MGRKPDLPAVIPADVVRRQDLETLAEHACRFEMPTTVDGLGQAAVEFDRQSRVYGATSLLRQVQAGLCLLRAKEMVPHGEWEGWVETHGLVPRTCRHRMQLANELIPEGWGSKTASVAVLRLETSEFTSAADALRAIREAKRDAKPADPPPAPGAEVIDVDYEVKLTPKQVARKEEEAKEFLGNLPKEVQERLRVEIHHQTEPLVPGGPRYEPPRVVAEDEPLPDYRASDPAEVQEARKTVIAVTGHLIRLAHRLDDLGDKPGAARCRRANSLVGEIESRWQYAEELST